MFHFSMYFWNFYQKTACIYNLRSFLHSLIPIIVIHFIVLCHKLKRIKYVVLYIKMNSTYKNLRHYKREAKPIRFDVAPTSTSPPRDVYLTFWRRAPFPLAAAHSWCWTRPTACWTWASSRRSARSSSRFGRTGRRPCSAPRGRRRCASWRRTSSRSTFTSQLGRPSWRPTRRSRSMWRWWTSIRRRDGCARSWAT